MTLTEQQIEWMRSLSSMDRSMFIDFCDGCIEEVKDATLDGEISPDSARFVRDRFKELIQRFSGALPQDKKPVINHFL